ncbi:CHAT domain-containing protein [Mycena vulgaris]|nr:CHAT domain-containing protein [Mycena vulgaris]
MKNTRARINDWSKPVHIQASAPRLSRTSWRSDPPPPISLACHLNSRTRSEEATTRPWETDILGLILEFVHLVLAWLDSCELPARMTYRTQSSTSDNPSESRGNDEDTSEFSDASLESMEIQELQQLVDRTPPEHPDLCRYRAALGKNSLLRYMDVGDLVDLQVAVKEYQEAVKLAAKENSRRSEYLQNLAASFWDRYRRLGNLDDLEAALRVDQELVDLTPRDDPKRGVHLHGLALCFTDRYKRLGHADDLEAAIDKFKEALKFTSEGHPERPSRLQGLAMSLTERHRKLGDPSDLDSAFQTSTEIDTESEETNIPQGQANQLQALSSELYSGMSSNPQGLAIKRQNLLEQIRQQTGIESFLLPKPYSVLAQASQGGPVVLLNSHEDHCDAIIMPNPTSDPCHVRLLSVSLDLLKSHRALLKDLVHRNVRSRGETVSSRLFGQREDFGFKSAEECFADMLDSLWTCVVSPVYQALASHGICTARLWWLPTGAFTGLPLHASPPTDQFIHSYTATLGLLLDAYAKKAIDNAPKGRKFPVQCLKGEQETVDAVKYQLENSSWLHLACHGKQDLFKPTKSCLLLYGETLELGAILHMPLSHAEFVFLAACQTAMGDAGLVNESFHLGGGFLAAGFRGTIGTMWSISDEDGPIVSGIVYSHLFRNGQQPQFSDAAEALQLAVKELRRRNICHRAGSNIDITSPFLGRFTVAKCRGLENLAGEAGEGVYDSATPQVQ